MDYWNRAENVNLRHHFFAAQAVHPQMRELGFGSIINLSSVAGADRRKCPLIPLPRNGLSATPHALARALGPDYIRVNAVEDTDA